MNKKINELLKQSGIDMQSDLSKFGMNEDMNGYNCQGFMLEQFAELIVKECIKELEIAKKCDPYNGDLYDCDTNSSLDYVIDALKDDFGVEE